MADDQAASQPQTPETEGPASEPPKTEPPPSRSRTRTAAPLSQRRTSEEGASKGKRSGRKQDLYYCADPRHAGDFVDEGRFFEVEPVDEDEPEHVTCPQGHVHHYGPLKNREIPPHLAELDDRLNQPVTTGV